MRKILLLSSVFAISFGVFATQNETYAGIATSKNQGIQIKNQGTIIEKLVHIWDRQIEVLEKQVTADQKSREQADAALALSTSQIVQAMGAVSQNSAITTQQLATTVTTDAVRNVGDYACSYLTADKTTGNAWVTTQRRLREIIEESKKLLAGETGSPYADGIVNASVILSKEAEKQCSDIEGGTRTCSGGDNSYLSVSTALTPKTIPASSNEALDLQGAIMLPARFPALQPDLQKNPNTNMRTINVESDRIRMLMSISPTVMASIRASREPTQGGGAIVKIRETLEAGGFLPKDEIDKLVPETGVSMMALFEAAGLALRNPNYMSAKYAAQPELVPITTAYIGGVQTTQLNRIIELLEFIAVGTSADVTLAAEDLMDKNAIKRAQVNASTVASIR